MSGRCIKVKPHIMIIKNLDFTLTKFRKLCDVVESSEYDLLTVEECLSGTDKSEKFIIFRHDVDRKPEKALKMARIEKEYKIPATYYFRLIPNVFAPNIIRSIKKLGHEIGYHYEVLDKANGNFDEAIQIFKEELKEFQKICDVKTICMHGNPLSKWTNKDLWGKYDFEDFGIIGEPYLSIDYNKVLYLTDTGRAWNSSRYSVKDVVQTFNTEKIKSTDDIISLIEKETFEQVCILAHPNRWNDDIGAWLTELMWQNIKNIGKTGIKLYEGSFHNRDN